MGGLDLFDLSQEASTPRGIWLPAFYAICAAWLARELSKWLLIGGVCAGALIWLSNIQFTVVGAIIFGAIIIGSCILNAGRIQK